MGSDSQFVIVGRSIEIRAPLEAYVKESENCVVSRNPSRSTCRCRHCFVRVNGYP